VPANVPKPCPCRCHDRAAMTIPAIQVGKPESKFKQSACAIVTLQREEQQPQNRRRKADAPWSRISKAGIRRTMRVPWANRRW